MVGHYVPKRGRFEDADDLHETVRLAMQRLADGATEAAQSFRAMGEALRTVGFVIEVERLEQRARYLKRYHSRGRAMRRAGR